jgi:hypothetical protein
MVPLMAMKNRTENSAPKTLSSMKAFFIHDRERPSISGSASGSMKNPVPEKDGDAVTEDVGHIFIQPLLALIEAFFGLTLWPAQTKPAPAEEECDETAG